MLSPRGLPPWGERGFIGHMADLRRMEEETRRLELWTRQITALNEMEAYRTQMIREIIASLGDDKDLMQAALMAVLSMPASNLQRPPLAERDESHRREIIAAVDGTKEEAPDDRVDLPLGEPTHTPNLTLGNRPNPNPHPNPNPDPEVRSSPLILRNRLTSVDQVRSQRRSDRPLSPRLWLEGGRPPSSICRRFPAFVGLVAHAPPLLRRRGLLLHHDQLQVLRLSFEL